jgi:ABC-type polysaccharide/polyol phosphate transport system ATPase subunit
MGSISAEHVSKRFRLYAERAGSVKERVTARRFARYEDFWALRGVDLEIDAGSTYGFIGHNGSGKSTMLRCVAGIYRPTEGRVRVSGRISALLELGAGFHPDLTGKENVYLNAAILGLSRKEIDSVFDDIVDFSGIGGFVDAPVKVYSSGMFVRLGFAVAVHVNPEILLIDEVVAVGDEEFQRRCFEHIHKLRREGVTIVLVSHSLGLVQSMCDHAAWFDHGRVLAEGSPVEVCTAYLTKVNADEQTARESDQDAGVNTELSRRGSGELRFTDLALLDRQGVRTMYAVPGEQLTVRMAFECNEPVDGPVFGVAIRHESGQLISLQTTLAADFTTGRVRGDGVVLFDVPDLPLLGGNYLINVYAVTKDALHVYDEVEAGLTLHVRSTESRGLDGLVDLRGGWRLDAEAAAT